MDTLAQVREHYQPYAEEELRQKQARLDAVLQQRQEIEQQFEEHNRLIDEAEVARRVLELIASHRHHPKHFGHDVASIDNLLRRAEEHRREFQKQLADIDSEELQLREDVVSLNRFLRGEGSDD